jgi:hypothetical protein
MSDSSSVDVNRRDFLQAGALTVAATAVTGEGTAQAQEGPPPAEPMVLPRRPLGKTGVDVTILNFGTFRNTGLQLLLRACYANGVRMFDTARSYGSEPFIARWLTEKPEVRKDIFLVTKDSPRSPSELLAQVDKRLEALQTDYIDLLFIHALGDRSIQDGIAWPKSQEFKETVEAIKKTKKVKFVGFSTHHKQRAEILQSAAEGGFVDAIMLQYTPWLEKDDPLNRAIDACHKKGIGLISMKQVAGQFTSGDRPKMNVLEEVKNRVPMLKERGLTPFQGLLHAIWTDERISACCVSMRNLDEAKQNSAAARVYQPVKEADLRQLRDACLAHGPTLCADCDGRCGRAAGTTAELGVLTRYLTYYEHLGDRAEARRLYTELTEDQRRWEGADLAAAREACPNHLDFAKLLPRVDRHLA